MSEPKPSGVSRRTIIRLGWAGATLLAVGGIGLALSPTEYREPRRKLKVLDRRDFSVLAAMADRFHPGGDGLPSAWELEVPEKVDAFLWQLHPADWRDVLKALKFVENAMAGALLDGRFSTFTAATPERQDEVLEIWRTSRLQTRRQIFKAVRSLTAASYWGDPRAWPHTGYPGPPDFGNFVPEAVSP